MNDIHQATAVTASRVDAVNQLVRATVTLGLLVGFVALAWIKEIDSGLYTNVFSIVIAFWFAQRTPSSKNGTGPPDGTGSTTVTAAAPSEVTVKPAETPKP